VRVDLLRGRGWIPKTRSTLIKIHRDRDLGEIKSKGYYFYKSIVVVVCIYDKPTLEDIEKCCITCDPFDPFSHKLLASYKLSRADHFKGSTLPLKQATLPGIAAWWNPVQCGVSLSIERESVL
jgi:hypothetical protein